MDSLQHHPSSRRRNNLSLAGALLILLALSVTACGSPVGRAAPVETSPEESLSAELPEVPDGLSTATPSGLIDAGETLADPASPNLQPSPAPDPLRFVFPTPKPAPVSAWRPPLYEIPWVPTEQDHFFFTRPIAADEVNWPLADYRYGGSFMEDVVHTGIDIPVPLDTPVLATGPGKVVWAGYGLYYLNADRLDDPYGIAVSIKHDFGYGGQQLYTIYGHMSDVLVVKGQHVEAGDIIGKVGTTGLTTGPHVHLEVRLKKNNYFGSRNPELWLSPPQGYGVLVGRVMSANGHVLESQVVQVHSYSTGQNWEVKSYSPGSTNSDPYYRENVVMGDLPAGHYRIWINYNNKVYSQDIEIRQGLVTYFTFKGGEYSLDLPESPADEFEPPDEAADEIEG